MFRSPKKPAPTPAGMGRQETAIWLGRALSSNQVVLHTILQLVHIIGVQQQALQAVARKQTGEAVTPEQAEALDHVDGPAGADILERLTAIETSLAPVLQAVDQACAVLEKEIS